MEDQMYMTTLSIMEKELNSKIGVPSGGIPSEEREREGGGGGKGRREIERGGGGSKKDKICITHTHSTAHVQCMLLKCLLNKVNGQQL